MDTNSYPLDKPRVFQCIFCSRTKESTPEILHNEDWKVVPYENYVLCPYCELNDWIKNARK